MKKKNRIIYWVATLWLALGMTSTGIVQLMGMQQEREMMAHLGYPDYLLALLGIAKILGVVALLIPKAPLPKEWAYAGFAFVMIGAVVSHLAVGDPAVDLFGPILLLALTLVSWYFRPAARRALPIKTLNYADKPGN